MLPRAFCNQFDLKKKEKTNSNKETIIRKFKGASLSSVHLWCQRQCLMTILAGILRKRTHFTVLRRSNLSGSSKALYLFQNKVKTLTLAQKALGDPVPVLLSAFILDQTSHCSLHFECLDTFMHGHSVIGIYCFILFHLYLFCCLHFC